MTEHLGFQVKLNASHADAIEHVTAALKEEGFGVLTRIDIDQAFREKIGAEFRAYTILGACNPKLAHMALSSNPEIGLMLPCNVVVEQAEEGTSIVRVTDPSALMAGADLGQSDTELAQVASDATQRMTRVVQALNGSAHEN